MQKTAAFSTAIARWALILTAAAPLIVKYDIFFPFAFSKAMYFRSLVELAAICLFTAFALRVLGGQGASWRLRFRHPLVIALFLFLVSYGVSAAFALNPYRAFWSDMERSEGVFGMLHYAALPFLMLFAFRKEDWLRYCKAVLIAGFILALYAILEFFGVRLLPFSLARAARPGSLTGNAAFFAVAMLFTMVFGGILATLAKGKWRIAAFLGVAFALLMIVLSGTRGVMLGIGAGILALLASFALRGGAAPRARKGAAAALLLLIVFGAVFWTTRAAPLWQRIPGLDRLAATATLDRNDASTQTRLLTWRVSWGAWKERPFLGWGPENYLYAWQKHYDPEFAVYGETWLDRAHNKVFDVLVTQGALGIAAYLLLFFALIATLIRRPVPGAWVIGAGLVAYFIQNLFLFDQVLSYSAFFALVGFVLSESGALLPQTAKSPSVAWRYAVPSLAFVASLGMVYGWYVWNMVPYRQSGAMFASARRGNVDEVVKELRRATTPYNYAQLNIRAQGIDVLYFSGYFSRDDYRDNPAFKGVGEILFKAMEELIAKEPFDVRLFIRYVEMLDPYGANDPSYYARADAVLRKALLLSPERQELYYHLAVNLAKQGKYEEAVRTAEHALGLAEGVARAHYHYALVLAAADRHAEALRELDRVLEIDPGLVTLLGGDHNSMTRLYAAMGKPEKAVELVMRSVRGDLYKQFEPELYRMTLNWFAERRAKEEVVAIARHLASVDPASKDDMEVILDLAEKERWDLIWGL